MGQQRCTVKYKLTTLFGTSRVDHNEVDIIVAIQRSNHTRCTGSFPQRHELTNLGRRGFGDTEHNLASTQHESTTAILSSLNVRRNIF